MGPEAIMLIKLLSDAVITITDTINRVSAMQAEEVAANIEMAEALSVVLRKRRESH